MVELVHQAPAAATPPPPVFVQYPMVMVHPHARKSIPCLIPGTERMDSLGRPIPGSGAYQGTPEYKPPVTVMNADHEAAARRDGYLPGGQSDVAAFERTASGGSLAPAEVIEYPKWVGHVLCNTREEEEALSSVKVAHAALEKPTEGLSKSDKAKAAWARRKAAQAA